MLVTQFPRKRDQLKSSVDQRRLTSAGVWTFHRRPIVRVGGEPVKPCLDLSLCQMVFDEADQMVAVEWLGKKCAGAKFQRAALMRLIGKSRTEHNRCLFIKPSDLAAQIDA